MGVEGSGGRGERVFKYFFSFVLSFLSRSFAHSFDLLFFLGKKVAWEKPKECAWVPLPVHMCVYICVSHACCCCVPTRERVCARACTCAHGPRCPWPRVPWGPRDPWILVFRGIPVGSPWDPRVPAGPAPLCGWVRVPAPPPGGAAGRGPAVRVGSRRCCLAPPGGRWRAAPRSAVSARFQGATSQNNVESC